ncbi:MAG TPA: hypothetical protein PKJ28_01420 [Bacteroidales bacterium]|nr:hypothetical protein [Bacteroidales bacterium]HPS72770.1 hypothetical protein [Bacteroidales bacterium]
MKKVTGIFFLALFLITGTVCPLKGQMVDSLILNLAEAKEDTSRVNILLRLSSIYLNNDPRKAESYISKALGLATQNNYYEGIANANYYMALLFKDSDVGLCEELLEKALENAEKTSDPKILAKIYNLKGITSLTNKMTDQAFVMMRKALSLEISAHVSSDSLLPVFIQNIGRMYLGNGNVVMAKKYFLDAIRTSIETKSKRQLAFPYMNLGTLYISDNQPDTGLYYYMLSLKTAKESNYNRILPELYNSLSEFYLTKADTIQTIDYAKLAVESATFNLNYDEKTLALYRLFSIYNKQHQPELAIQYLMQYVNLKDTISQNKQRHNTDMAELKLKFQNSQIINDLKLRKQKVTIYITAFFSLLLLIAGGSVIYIHKLKNKHRQMIINSLTERNKGLEKEITYKSQELTNNMLLLAQRNELLRDVIQRVRDFQHSTPGEFNEKLNNLINELKFSLRNDIWELFEKEFLGVHPVFFENLSKNHPELTPKEKRLCALLRLNLNSKEISEITHLNNESVMKARTRLRRHFGLTNTDISLTTYLSRF